MRYVRSSAPYACAYTLSCCEVNTRTRTATPVPEKREVRWRPQNSSTSAHHPSSEPFRGATSYTVYPYKNASIIVKTIYASVYNVEQIVDFFMFQGIKKSNDRLKKSTIRLGGMGESNARPLPSSLYDVRSRLFSLGTFYYVSRRENHTTRPMPHHIKTS